MKTVSTSQARNQLFCRVHTRMQYVWDNSLMLGNIYMYGVDILWLLDARLEPRSEASFDQFRVGARWRLT